MTSPESSGVEREAPSSRETPVDPPQVAVTQAVRRALDEDLLPLGDLTASLVPEEAVAGAQLVSRAQGVLAGTGCAAAAFALVDHRISVDWRLRDGARLAPGAVIASIEGPMRSVLSAERTCLNFLCHLSGVATLARRYAEAVREANPRTRVLDTRKTTPGLRALEKAAVRAGGGHNHRASLSDAVLLKDNHLMGIGIAEAVGRARQMWPGRFVEVECDRIEQVRQAIEARASAVLLDNMTLDEVKDAVDLVRAAADPSGLLVEVSGGVNLSSAPGYARAGVDLISIGALTHSAPALDIGLDMEAQRCS